MGRDSSRLPLDADQWRADAEAWAAFEPRPVPEAPLPPRPSSFVPQASRGGGGYLTPSPVKSQAQTPDSPTGAQHVANMTHGWTTVPCTACVLRNKCREAQADYGWQTEQCLMLGCAAATAGKAAPLRSPLRKKARVLQFGEVGGPMLGPGRFAAVPGSGPGAVAAGGLFGAQQPAEQPAAGLQGPQQQSARRGASSALEAALRDYTGPSDSIPATIMRDPELSTFISPRALQVCHCAPRVIVPVTGLTCHAVYC